MKPTELKILLQEGEGTMLEYKEGLSASFARELVAMANTAGGKILLGVRDDGTVKRIRDEAREQGCPEPVFEEGGFVTATFYPNPEVKTQAGTRWEASTNDVAGKAGTKLALSRHQVEMLAKCQEDQPLVSLLAITGRSDRTKFRIQVLGPMLAEELLEMTIPDKPRSSKQRYRITRLGLEVLQKAKKEKSALAGRTKSTGWNIAAILIDLP